MKLYSSVCAVDAVFDGMSCAFFEQLDDFSLWMNLKQNVSAQTAEQWKILGDAIFAQFPASVCEARKAGLDNATRFFEFVFAFPEVARRNRQRLNSLLRDLELRLKNNRSDADFTVSEDELGKLLEQAKKYAV